MKLSEQLQQAHESGDFGEALEWYSVRAKALELQVKALNLQVDNARLALIRCHDEFRVSRNEVVAEAQLRMDLEDIFGFTVKT